MLAGIDEAPKQGDHHDRHDHGHEIDGPEDVDALELLIDHQCQEQSQPGLDRRDDDDERDRVDQRLRENKVAR